jgi:cell division initiation protein
MIDLTPLDVRNKRGDFKKLMRGYDPDEVNVFLELVAERLEGLVRENLQLRERAQTLQQQVESQLGREQAVQDALVTAQELRADIQTQTEREAGHIIKEAEIEARRVLADADAEARSKVRSVERRTDAANDTLIELERRRTRFLRDFRQLLERELDVVNVEQGRVPLEDRAIDLDLGPTPRAETEDVEESETEAGPGPEAGEAAEAGAEPEASVTGEWKAGSRLESVHEPERPNGPDAGVREGPPSSSPPEELSASFEAEAVAEAQSQIVEVTSRRADDPSGVPRLEDVLAEAGAELVDSEPEEVSGMPQSTEEISPPPITGRRDDALLLYLDSDESER